MTDIAWNNCATINKVAMRKPNTKRFDIYWVNNRAAKYKIVRPFFPVLWKFRLYYKLTKNNSKGLLRILLSTYIFKHSNIVSITKLLWHFIIISTYNSCPKLDLTFNISYISFYSRCYILDPYLLPSTLVSKNMTYVY